MVVYLEDEYIVMLKGYIISQLRSISLKHSQQCERVAVEIFKYVNPDCKRTVQIVYETFRLSTKYPYCQQKIKIVNKMSTLSTKHSDCQQITQTVKDSNCKHLLVAT